MQQPAYEAEEGDYPISNYTLARVKQDWLPQDCPGGANGKLPLRKGEMVYVLEQSTESGWFGGHREGEDLTGWFPAAYVELLDNDEDGADSKPRTSPTAGYRQTRSPMDKLRGSAVTKQELMSVASPNRSGPRPVCANPELHKLQHEIQKLQHDLSCEKKRCKALEDKVSSSKEQAAAYDQQLQVRDQQIQKFKDEYAKEVPELRRRAERERQDREAQSKELNYWSGEAQKAQAELAQARAQLKHMASQQAVKPSGLGAACGSLPRYAEVIQDGLPLATAGFSVDAHELDQASSSSSQKGPRPKDYSGKELGLFRGDTGELDPEQPSPGEHKHMERPVGSCNLSDAPGGVSVSLSVYSNGEEFPRRTLFTDEELSQVPFLGGTNPMPTLGNGTVSPQVPSGSGGPAVVRQSSGGSSINRVGTMPVSKPRVVAEPLCVRSKPITTQLGGAAASSAAVQRAPSWQGRTMTPMSASGSVQRERSGGRPWATAAGTGPAGVSCLAQASPPTVTAGPVAKLVNELERRTSARSDSTGRNIDKSPMRYVSTPTSQSYQPPAVARPTGASSVYPAATRSASGGRCPMMSRPHDEPAYPASTRSAVAFHRPGEATETPRSHSRPRAPAAFSMHGAPVGRMPSEDAAAFAMSPLSKVQPRSAAASSPARCSPAARGPIASVKDRIQQFGGAQPY